MSLRQHRIKPSRIPLTKRNSERIHAIRRGEQRFDLSFEDVVIVKEMIRAGHSKSVERQSRRVVIHEVVLRGKSIKAVYDTARHEVVTFLPSNIET